MQQLTRAKLKITWYDGAVQDFDVQFNPKEFSLEKSLQLAEINIPGLDSPLQHFVRGQSEKLTVALFFDTTDKGMGAEAVSVTKYSDRVYQLLKIEPERHAPPVCEFFWNSQFPGDHIGDSPDDTPPNEAGALAAIATASVGLLAAATTQASIAGGAAAGIAAGTVAAGAAAFGIAAAAGAFKNLAGLPAPAARNRITEQKRHSFKGIAEKVEQKFTLFSSEGIPLRATVTLTLREYKTLHDQLTALRENSPDKTQVHILQQGENLPLIAARHYRDANEWRRIATANGIEDPRRLSAGAFLRLPPLES